MDLIDLEMENLKIGFDRDFRKLYFFDPYASDFVLTKIATLIDAHPIEKFSEVFSYYDTCHENHIDPFTFDEKSKYLLLIFYDAPNEHLFTTLRKDTKENRLKYFRNIGREFVIEIQG